MQNILCLVAAVLVIFWLVGVVGYSAGGIDSCSVGTGRDFRPGAGH